MLNWHEDWKISFVVHNLFTFELLLAIANNACLGYNLREYILDNFSKCMRYKSEYILDNFSKCMRYKSEYILMIFQNV